jgi:hypothetical protein
VFFPNNPNKAKGDHYYQLRYFALIDTIDEQKPDPDSGKLVERKLAKAYLKFYVRPKYLIKHRNMIKVLMGTLFRSYFLPKIMGGTPDVWYNSLKDEYS